MHNEFNRGNGGRGSRTPRGAFGHASGTGVSLEKRAKILRASDQVRAKVESHHANHQASWTTKRYGDLLRNAGNTKRPAPLGLSTDPKEG